MGDQLRFFFDEDVRRSRAVADELRLRGIDALTTAEARRASLRLPDSDQLSFAAANDRVLVTQDRRLVPGIPHKGAVVMRSIGVKDYADFLELVARVYSAGEIENQVIYFS